jgi:serine phosphatase RsbU (regulator of sigma subunit)
LINRRTYILLFCGVVGLLCYFYLRPSIEYYASGPIADSKSATEDYISQLAPALGFSTDSLALLTMRKQHQYYVKTLQDTLPGDISLSTLNEGGVHTQSWETVIGQQNKSNGVFATSGQLFEQVGALKVNTSNAGRVIRVESHSENSNPTFLTGDSLLTIARNLVGYTFGYNLDEYTLSESTSPDDSTFVILEERNQRVMLDNSDLAESLNVTWKRKEGVTATPAELSLSLKPVIREINNEDGFRTEFGYSISSFKATDIFEPADLDSPSVSQSEEDFTFTFGFFLAVFILAILIFSVGIRNIFKGKVEWRRALLMFLAIAAGSYGWRAIFFMDSYNPFLSNAGMIGGTFNNLLIGLVLGLYTAMAYISWEALARSQKQRQVDIIDALWQRKFFISETGAALVNGFAIGGIIIGIMSGIVFLLGEFLLQADSQFGYAEAGIGPRLLTMNMSMWTTTWLVCVAQVGFVYSILNHWIKKEWLVGILAILFSGLCITVLGRLIGTSGSGYQDLMVYLGVAVILIYALREFGLLTVSTAWWFFTSFFMIQPYLGSGSMEVAYVGWVQLFIMAGPFIYGFIAYRYGASVSEVGDYIPEYEERIAQHLRVEKEIEIARESQYKLMPPQPPKADGFDVYGFFLPSFEVGGDYFDYVLTKNKEGEAKALTMVVVDVSGKAMRAAMPAIFTSGLLLSRMKDDMPDEVLSQISEPIFSRTDKRTFITCALARYDLESKKMSVANAGHCRPVLKRNGLAEFIHTPEPAYPLGLREEVTYRSQSITMKKGDFFLLYSDGLPEAVNEKGERFGFDSVPRLIESIDTETLSAHEIAQEIKRTVQKFSNYQLADDTTIICLKV